MRDYAMVSPKFWTGRTGKALKAAGPEAVIVGFYLMTSPHSNMIGVYHCPVAYIAIDTGLAIEGASKGLEGAIEAGFCIFDDETDYVFVREFAAYQVGTNLKPRDKRSIGVQNELDKVPQGQCRREFQARYAIPFNLDQTVESASFGEAPSKPLGCQEQEQEQELPTEAVASVSGAARASASRGHRLSKPWELPEAWGDATRAAYPHWSDGTIALVAASFADHWHSKSGKDASKLDWEATWRNWCRSDITQRAYPSPGAIRETTFQRAARQRIEAVAPAIAAKPPGVQPARNPMEILDGYTRNAG